jgi:predicted O-methyltransferase YrrM
MEGLERFWVKYQKHSLMLFDEIVYLYQAVKSTSSDVLEIGAYHGVSTLLLAKAIGGEKRKVYSVDPHLSYRDRHIIFGPVDNCMYHNIVKDYADKINTINLESEQAFRAIGNQKFGLIFIDGNHEEKAVKKDVVLWSDSLIKGGYLIFHDGNYLGPKIAIDKLKKSKKYSLIGKVGEMVAFIKEDSK